METTIGGQEKFKDLVRNSPEVYFLVRAYDDITDTGATGPYSVVFSICMSQDCRSGKVSTFKYQFDNLWDAEGVDLQLNEVYADGTQANNGMFYFSKKIDLSSVPFNVDERGFAILNPVMDWLNTSDQWQTFRFQVDVLDNTCIDEIENTCMGVLDSRCIDELETGCKRASTYKDISVPPDPTHSIPEILVDSFSHLMAGEPRADRSRCL